MPLVAICGECGGLCYPFWDPIYQLRGKEDGGYACGWHKMLWGEGEVDGSKVYGGKGMWWPGDVVAWGYAGGCEV